LHRIAENPLDKAPDAFRTISEVADEIDVPQHVLRFWESRFPQIRPMKRGGGRRYYRRDDVDLLRGVRHLLYGEGYTIRGVQRILREQGAGFVQNVWRAGAEPPPPQRPEDRDEAAATSEMLPEPNLFAVSPPGGRERADYADGRREPTLEAAAAIEPPARPLVAPEDRRKLQSALDELVACRQIIDNALRQD
jgi:DNA-binding transcriptional MerR regulator